MLIKLQSLIFWNIQVWSLTHTITVYDDQKAKASEVITGLQATINQLHKPITRISTATTTTTTNTNSNSQQLPPLTSFVYPDNDQVIHIIEPPKQFQQMKKIMQQAPNQWKLHLLGNQRLKPLSKMSTNIFKPEIKNDVIETYSMFTKRPKSYYINNNKKPNPYNYMDAYNEETQSPQSMMPKYSAFPLEILASVRKTKRYFLKSKPQISKAKQRLRSQKIQTVVFENGHEQGQLEKGKQKHVQGIRENYIKANNNNIKRVKRDLTLKRKTMIPPTIKPLTGEHLLQYINELLKNATTFLTFKEADNDKAVELETSTLTGELLLSKEKKPAPTLPLLTNQMVTETLDNSFKATNALINYLKIQAKVSEAPDLCQLNIKHSSLGVDFKEMQQHLNCVKNEMQQLNTSLIKPSLQILTNNPYAKAKLGNEYNGAVENTPKEPINTTLIYDDIMSAIRTISQQNTDNNNNNTNLTVIEDINDPLEQENIHKLNQYINSLQNLLVHIPHYINAAPRLMKRSNKKSLTQPIRNNIYAPVIAVKRNFNAPTPRRIYQHYPIVVMRTEYLKNDTDFIPSNSSLVHFS